MQLVFATATYTHHQSKMKFPLSLRKKTLSLKQVQKRENAFISQVLSEVSRMPSTKHLLTVKLPWTPISPSDGDDISDTIQFILKEDYLVNFNNEGFITIERTCQDLITFDDVADIKQCQKPSVSMSRDQMEYMYSL